MTQRSGIPGGSPGRPQRRTRTQNAPRTERTDEFAASELQESGNPFVSAFDQVADALYALPPADFTTARNAASDRARRAGDRTLATRIHALRRPTAAAHALNLLVRAHPEYVDQLRELGHDLLEAQTRLEGERLRELTRQRNALVSGLTREARRAAAAAGQPVGEQAVAELDQTLRAVLADPHAADELAAGRLVHSLIPGSTLPAVPAGTAPRPSPRPSSGTRAAEKQRQQRLADAERSVRQLEAQLSAAEADLARARAKADRAAERLHADQDRLHAAEQTVDKARAAVTTAEEEAAQTRNAAKAAERSAGQARKELADQEATLAGLRSAVEPSP